MHELISKCLNCNHELLSEDKYCSVCGQKTDAHLLTLKELFSSFWSSLTNLDNSVFKTLKYIWAPWKLTRYYVEGKKKSFVNPVRIFIITLIFHFGLLISTIDLSQNSFTKDLYVNYEKNKLYKQYLEIKKEVDTTRFRPVLVQIDSNLFKDGPKLLNDTITNFYFNKVSFAFSGKDIVEMKIDSMYKHYGYTTFLNKLMAKQIVRALKDPDSTIKYVLGNLIWAILLAILILTGFFKLIYWRKKLPYVEHLIFLLNVHSLTFILNSLIFYVTNKFFVIENDDVNANFALSLVLIPCIIFFLSVYKYYYQSVIKTLMKSILSFFVYITANSFFIFLTAFISFLLF